MKTIQLLTLTLLATSLTLGSVTLPNKTPSTIQQQNSISNSIATSLYRRGLEKESAIKITKNIIDENEELFSLMLHNYLNKISINQDAIFTELGQLALLKKDVDFSSYSFLVGFTQSMTNQKVDKETLSKLSIISSDNSLLKRIFA